jgi:hypothetical protein
MPHKTEHLRWTQEKAAREFGVNPRTLRNRLTQLSISAGADEMFSTGDICRAVFGDYDGEALQKLAAERELAQLELAEKKGAVISADKAFLDYSALLQQIKREIELLPQTLAETLANKPPLEIQKLAQSEIDSMLKKLSKPERPYVEKSTAQDS